MGPSDQESGLHRHRPLHRQHDPNPDWNRLRTVPAFFKSEGLCIAGRRFHLVDYLWPLGNICEACGSYYADSSLYAQQGSNDDGAVHRRNDGHYVLLRHKHYLSNGNKPRNGYEGS